MTNRLHPASIKSPLLAAISFAASGGGVAVVARLLQDVFEQEWGKEARSLTLIGGQHSLPSFIEKSRYALRLAQLQFTGEVDWMLFAHLNLAKPLLGVPRTRRKPYSIFLHGIEAWCPLPPAQLELLANAQRRIANSTFTARRVMAEHPGIGPVDACPLALPVASPLAPVRSTRADSTLGPHAVLVVGRMLEAERYKGHDELVDAWPAVVARVPDARLVIAGGGNDLARLRDKAARSSARSSIVFTGFIERSALDALYEQAALFALTSRGEGFGLVYLEAMAHELACVGSIHDAAGDVVIDGVTGRLVDQSKADHLASVLADLLMDDESRRRMGRAGLERLREQFTFESFARRLLPLLDASFLPTTRRSETATLTAAVTDGSDRLSGHS